LLEGGDLRSIGKADRVAKLVLRDRTLVRPLVKGLMSDHPVLRMRSADVLEKVSREKPEFLKRSMRTLLDRASVVPQQEVRWHLALIYPRLNLEGSDRRKALKLLASWLESESKIVVVTAMQGLADFAMQDPALRPRVRRLLERHREGDSPAARARARKLLRALPRRSGAPPS
jgi:hypothetical protein